jgi:hypothetical protein
MELPYDPVVALLGIYPKKCKSVYTYVYSSTNHNNPVIESPKCSSVNEWLKKMWNIYTMDFYSALKNEMMSFAEKWMEMKSIT